jgi:hypothetical protein
MPRLALKTSSSNGEYNGDCDVAVIDVTPELVALIERRLTLAQELYVQDHDLRELQFYGSTAEFYDYDLVNDLQEFCDDEFSEEYDNVGEGEIPDNFDLSQYVPESTECDRMLIRLWPTSSPLRHEVGWCAIPKHSGVVVTCTVEIDTLRELLSRSTA